MNNFSPQSKVWVYQSNREFNTAETEEIKKIGLLFTRDWTAHGSQLNASLDILYNRFIVLMVDENDASASGCSIDKSLAFIKNIEQQFNWETALENSWHKSLLSASQN